MKIRYGNVTLCDGATRGVGQKLGVKNFRISDQRVVQVSPVVGADLPRVNARGNKAINVSFEVEVEHSSVDVAETYCLSLYASLPNSGVLAVSAGGGSRPTSNQDFSSAALETSEHRSGGVRTYHRYQFVIGYSAT